MKMRGRPNGGLGLLVRKALGKVEFLEGLSEGVMWVRIKGKNVIMFVCVCVLFTSG